MCIFLDICKEFDNWIAGLIFTSKFLEILGDC